ncbi:hypothetical protein GL58_04150 [Comamonas testosteroni]|uniref:Uncharacterized protein n=1 Tax=Comamonas testosteroni TaxID=285 RepID=A0A0L7MQC5_COMTE|nr:hypothetical protein GL58_04150 [Comamonas testosteroni]
MNGHSSPLPTAIKHFALLDAVMNAENLDDRSFDTAGAIARGEHRPAATVDKHPCMQPTQATQPTVLDALASAAIVLSD